MKIIKYVFLFLLAIVIVGAVYLATLDGTYDVKRSRVINVHPEVAYNDLNEYKNWKNWGPWYETDSTIVATYPEQTSGEGGSYSWTSSKDGSGEMRTIKADKPNRLDQEIVFKTPFGDMKSDVYWTFEKVAEGTNVTWGMKGAMSFITRWMAKDMESQIGPMEDRGLELFDTYINKKTKVYSITSNGVVDHGGSHYLYLTTSCKIAVMEKKMTELIGEIITYVKKNNIQPSGNLFSLYHEFNEEEGNTMFSVCFPVSEKMITSDDTDIVSGYMERGQYYKTTLKGSYDNAKEAWETAYKKASTLEDYQLVEKGEPFEVYVNSPHHIKNPAALISEIYIPVVEKKE